MYIPLTRDHQVKVVCSTQQYANKILTNKFSLTCFTPMPNTIKKKNFLHRCEFVAVEIIREIILLRPAQ